MLYSFDTDHAEEYGVDEAIMLHNILFWTAKNKANRQNMHEGKFWTYNSAKALSDLFPFWNPQKIRRILISLEKQGAIVVGNFNKKGYDQTKWYSSPLLDSFFKNENSIVQNCNMESSELNNALFKSEQPIPDSKPDSKPNSKHRVENLEVRLIKLLSPNARREELNKMEASSLNKVKRPLEEHDMELLEYFFALDKSKDYDQTWKRKQSLVTILNNIEDQLDLAYEMKQLESKKHAPLTPKHIIYK